MKKTIIFFAALTLLASCHAQPTPPQAASKAKNSLASAQKPNREAKVAKLLTTGLDVPLTSSERREVAYYIDSLTAAHKINRKPLKP